MRRYLIGSMLLLSSLAVGRPSSSHAFLSIPYYQCWAGFVDSNGHWRCTQIAWCTVYQYTGDWYCDVYDVPGL